MKKFVLILVVAILGGFSSLMIQRAFFPDNNVNLPKGIISEDKSSIPSSFAHLLANTPTTLPDFSIVAEMTVNTVVHIRAEFERPSSVYDEFLGPDAFRDFFFGPRQRRTPQSPAVGAGSGVIISRDGYVVTNNHVVQDASLVEVTLNNNEIYTAKVIGTDPTTDLALLKIEGTDLPYALFGDSDKVKVGEWVLAVGNPFNLTSTVTAGIVSAKGRQINILGGRTAIESFIQTDAAVNRGNSGGALVNTAGELIGINAAIASTTGTFAGYSFAIPSNIAKKVTMDLMEFGEVQRGFLGVEIQEVNPRLARELELKVNRGVYVGSVAEGSAGSQAGLKQGDVITSIEGVQTNTTSALMETLGRKRPGDQITVTYNRDGRIMEGKAVLKNIHGDTGIVQRGENDIIEVLGAKLENLNNQDMSRLNIRNGVKIQSLGNGRLARAGIKEGFVITHIDRQPVASAREITDMLKDKSGGVLVEGVYQNGTRAYYGVGL